MASDITDPGARRALQRARALIVLFGTFGPYLARLPGAAFRGVDWLSSYFPSDPSAWLFFAAFNAIGWGAVLVATVGLRRARSAWFPAVLGFGFPCLVHSQLDLASDAQAAIVLIFVPIYSLPLVLVGGLLGHWYDRRGQKRHGVS